MATASPNTTVGNTSFNTAQTLFSVAGGDTPCKVYTVHNRDASIYVRVAVRTWVSGAAGPWLAAGSDGGAAVAPGASVPFAVRAGLIGLVQVWAESGSPIVDGFVEAQ